ncbi:MAG TPA: HDOD domain-containing protein [Terriglobales bacterium]|nr:HDOD domain-containing protein [Terriglobales bacterium]
MTLATGTSKAAEPMELLWDPDSIPPFPAIALKALNLMSGTDTSLLELCNLIRSDLAFSTAILRIANSPLVAFPKNVTSVLQAAMLLGFQRLRSVVITVGLKAYLKDLRTPLMQSCWRHSVACGIIAERSAKWRFLDKDFAYTAGILHDIGRVALATVMPGAYARLIERGADRPQDLLQSEREFCGIDHCQAGRLLVTVWNLPEAFLAITACHHDLGVHLPVAASLIPPSCALADSLGFAVIRCRSPRSCPEILAEFPEPARNRFPADAEELASEIANEIKVIESA